ncbi:MAG: hypothetical protein AB8B51_10940 [Sedimentitalea sp.]
MTGFTKGRSLNWRGPVADMLPLIIIGIALVAIAAAALIVTLVSAKKDADENFPDTPVDDPVEPCPLEHKIKLVEFVEVLDRGSEGVVKDPGGVSAKKPTLVTRADKANGLYQQFVNLDQDLEGKAKRHPEYGRYIIVRARVEWVLAGRKASLSGKKVEIKLKNDATGKGNPGGLDGPDKHGLKKADGDLVEALSTDAEGWTEPLQVHFSIYAGDTFSVSAQADEEDGGSYTGTIMKLGTYQVWRRFWYQMTQRKGGAAPAPTDSVKAYAKVCADMVKADAKEFEKKDAPANTIYPDWMVNPGTGSNDDATVIGNHNSAAFYTMFDAETDKPVKGHLIICDYQWDDAGRSGLTTFEINKTPSDELTVDLGRWNAGIVRPALSGGSLLSNATWRSKAPSGHADHGKSGALSDADIQIIKGRSGLNCIKVKLPAGAPDPTVHKVEVKFKIAYGTYWGGESVAHQMLIKYSGKNKNYYQCVSHEFGHGFAQTPCPGDQPSPLGNHPKQYDTAKGGQGVHCNDAATLVMTNPRYPGGIYKTGTCIMYHQLSPSICTQVFCDTCEPYLRLEEFKTLVRGKSSC